MELLQCPYEDQNKSYIKSFDLSEKENINQFFEKYGVVVIRDVINNKECEDSQQEIWDELQKRAQNNERISKDDFQTLEHVCEDVKRVGMLSKQPIMTPQAIKNRINQNIYNAYCSATNQNQFIVAQETYGFMRPLIKNEWKTMENWLHIDMNLYNGCTSTVGYEPSKANINTKLKKQENIQWQNAYFQGIVALEDCPEETGGLHVVPGFHKYAQKWCQDRKPEIQNCPQCKECTQQIKIPLDEEYIFRYLQKIPIRKGSLVIWDGRLAHSNFPNSSLTKPRFVQYIKMNAVGNDIVSNVKPIEYDENKYIQLDDLGKKLHGLIPWQ